MKKILIAILVIGIAGGVGGYMYYNKPHKDAGSSASDFKVEAAQLVEEFATDETAANGKYLDKVVEVSGTVRSVQDGEDGSVGLMIDTGDPMSVVSCRFDPGEADAARNLEEGSPIAVKGIVNGYLFDEVQMNRCALAEK